MFKKIIYEKNRIFAAFLLITIGVLTRLILNGIFFLDLFFVIAIISLLSGLLIGGYYTFIVPISTMIITDLILGNTLILLFTWSGFVIIGIIGYILKSKNSLKLKRTPTIIGAGIGGILLYDLWTNFGCWLGWYPHTTNGLLLCYTNAIPFTLWHLFSTTLALTILILPIVYLKENKIIKTDFTINTFEKRITLISPAILMILSVITLIV